MSIYLNTMVKKTHKYNNYLYIAFSKAPLCIISFFPAALRDHPTLTLLHEVPPEVLTGGQSHLVAGVGAS